MRTRYRSPSAFPRPAALDRLEREHVRPSAFARRLLSDVLGERGVAWLRERRMLRDARGCPASSDPEVERTIRDWVKPGMVVVDAGAHQGLWTFRLARAVGPSGHVFAFEPSTE